MYYTNSLTSFSFNLFLNTKNFVMKVSVIGAGAVGATCANDIVRKHITNEVVLLDIKEGFAEGKVQDMLQTAALLGFSTKVRGVTGDYSKTNNSDVVVITSGIPRKPGMSREELVGTNAKIVGEVIKNVLEHSPNAIILVIANPMDTMTYLALKSTGIPKNRIFGMGGALDSSRFRYQLSSKLNCSPADLNAMVIGGHGDKTMIPLIRHATWNSVPVTNFLSKEEQEEVVAATKVGGATLTKLIGTSAWYAPGAAGAFVVESILKDEKRLIPSCVYLDGEYGQKDICIGVPAVIGRNGVEKIIDIDLNEEEKTLFSNSADAVRDVNKALNVEARIA